MLAILENKTTIFFFLTHGLVWVYLQDSINFSEYSSNSMFEVILPPKKTEGYDYTAEMLQFPRDLQQEKLTSLIFVQHNCCFLGQ